MSRVTAASPHRILTLGDYASTVAWDATGQWLAVGSLSGETVVIDVAAGAVAELPAHTMGTLAVAWSRGGRLASGGQDGMVRLWSPTDGPIGSVQHRGWCTALAWSPTEEVLAAGVGSSLGVVRVEGEPSGEWHDELPSTVTSVVWATNGRWAGAGCYGGVHWFEPGVADRVRVMERKGSVLSTAVSGDGRWLAAGNQDAEVKVWRLWSGEDLRMRGFASKVTALAWHPSSTWLSVADEGAVASWSFRGKGPAGTAPAVLQGHEGTVTALDYRVPDGLLATGATDGTVLFWHSPEARSPMSEAELGTGVAALCWSHDGSVLAVLGADGTVATVTP